MGTSDGPSPGLQALPNELLGSICCLLCNRDIKSLRLTCRALGVKSYLRFDRGFISANPRNIEVLLAVANHNIFRHRVKEIIWDDNVLRRIPITEGYTPCGYIEDEHDFDDLADDENKEWISRDYVHLCKESIFYTNSRVQEKNKYEGENEVQKQLDNLMPTRDSLALYNDLLYQQKKVLSSNADEEAFRRQWRGFCIVTKALADYADKLHIAELVVDGHKLPTGIDYTLFDKPNAEYDSLCRIVARPGFQRLVLTLTTGYRENFDGSEDWGIYKNGRISSLLAKATDIEEVVLQTDYGLDSSSCDMEDFVSLFDIFPIDSFSMGKLKHFGLSGFAVKQDDLISFLGKLPSTLKSVDLSCLSLVEGHGNHATMLADIRDKLGWRNRPAGQRIKVSISMRDNQPNHGRYICLDKEVEEYIYGDGPPPFLTIEGMSGAYFTFGTGIIYDEFDPGFAIPYEWD
ncbi:hypothetical protein FDENT_11904 [Fusarium denticulatum]|uniref:F-box domain-containing protein n=1 Tax=Fusarium denticulatum TaxID=48507 RepID=A0A8H5TE82_9HYPO|nr:hypothetical protein FDENT_11904 [Fusarium denticulatum]